MFRKRKVSLCEGRHTKSLDTHACKCYNAKVVCRGFKSLFLRQSNGNETSREQSPWLASLSKLICWVCLSIIRLLAKPTGRIISSPPCAAGSLLSHPSVMPTDSPSCIWIAQHLAVVAFLKKKEHGLIQTSWTGCLGVCDGCAGYVPTPWAGKPDNQLYSVFKFLLRKGKALQTQCGSSLKGSWQISIIVLQWNTI